MTTELRVLEPAEWDSWFAVLARAFGDTADVASASGKWWRPLAEFERCVSAVDGDTVVGTAGSFSFRMTVPGGASVPTGGLTMVSVAGTHRRQGLLSAMMRWQLDLARARGECLAILTASEPAIYGRFGYGIASHLLRAEIDTSRVRVAVPPGAEDLRLRWEEPAKALAACEALFAGTLTERPGMLERSPAWQQAQVDDPPEEREGAGPLQCVLAERDGVLAGYARYSVTPVWGPAGADGRVEVRELVAADPAAYARLWRFLADLDLTSTVRATKLAVDDPLLHLVSDNRRCLLGVRDATHLRLVDVGAALAARTYLLPVDTVFEVTDAYCPWNSGRWRLRGDAAGAVCTRTGDAAELALDVRELGAVYLGGVSLAALAGAGLVTELRPGALARVGPALGSVRAPYLTHGF